MPKKKRCKKCQGFCKIAFDYDRDEFVWECLNCWSRFSKRKTKPPESRILEAGGILIDMPGAKPAYQLGRKLIWIIPGQKQVLVGYAHNPDQQGVLMSLKSALEV